MTFVIGWFTKNVSEIVSLFVFVTQLFLPPNTRRYTAPFSPPSLHGRDGFARLTTFCVSEKRDVLTHACDLPSVRRVSASFPKKKPS